VPGFPLYRDREDKLEREVRNATLQFLAVLYYAENWKTEVVKLTPEILKKLQFLAINQIYTCAGTFRDGEVTLGVRHQPPEHTEVPGLVEEMCAYVNEKWAAVTATHLAAYLMWRLNWIHPFFGGNGRTSRAISYLVLCARLELVIPGERTIPDLIESNPKPYYDALRAADEAWENGKLNLSEMETLLGDLLGSQLMSFHNKATGLE
jgi:hypothetical protein